MQKSEVAAFARCRVWFAKCASQITTTQEADCSTAAENKFTLLTEQQFPVSLSIVIFLFYRVFLETWNGNVENMFLITSFCAWSINSSLLLPKMNCYAQGKCAILM